MGFQTNVTQQMSVNDKQFYLTEREMRILKGSWAEDFANHIFPNLVEEPFSVLFSDNKASKPNVPINIILGLFMLKEQFDLTDEEMMHQLLFNIQFQYALHTSSFSEQPINDNTFRRFRNRVSKYEAQTGVDLVKDAFKALRDKIADIMEIDPAIKRVDSLMISSGCRRLSRLDIMSETLRLVTRELKKNGAQTPLTEKYVDNGESNDIGYRLKREDVPVKMDELLRDALTLIAEYPEELKNSESYAILERMVEDQSRVDGDGRTVKTGKEISPESMQTPHDPSATYRKKAGKGNIGYVANVEETCDGEKRLITDYDLQKNTYSDAQFAEDMVEAMPDGGGETETAVFDGAYVSTELLEKAEAKNVELATTSLIGGMQGTFETKFEIDESGNIAKCPAGCSPIDARRGNNCYLAHFDADVCENCQYCDRCPGVFQKSAALIKFSDTALKRAKYALIVGTEKYRAFARFRNGVEGIPSILRRKYDVDHMREKGEIRKRQRFGFKMMTINAKSLFKWRDVTVDAKDNASFSLYYSCFYSICNIFPLFLPSLSFA